MGQVALLHTAADVTPEWLTDASDPGRRGGAGEPGSSTSPPSPSAPARWPTRPVSPSPTTDPAPGPASVVGKFASADDQSRAPGWRCGPTRSRSASTARSPPGSPPGCPPTYVAEIEPETGWFTLLLEDIVGGTQGDQIAACSPDVAAAVLDEMAGLHAPCWESPELAGLEWLNRNTPEADEFLAAMVSTLLPGFLERYADTMAPEHQEVCRVFAEHMPAYVAPARRRAAHGEPRRLPPRQPPLPARRPAAGRGRLADRGLGRRGASTWPTSSAAASPPRTAAPTSPSSWPTTTTRCAAAACRTTRSSSCGPTPGRDVRRASSWRSSRPWSCSAPSGATSCSSPAATRHAQHALDVDAPALLLAAG